MESVQLKESYINWLNEEITINKVGEYIEMTTPFLDRYNDYLQIFIKNISDNNFLLSDDSYIINNLLASGVDISSPKRKKVLESILKKYGIQICKNELFVNATLRDLPQKKHSLLQAMLNIDDMFMLSQSKVASVFLDDVQSYFDKSGIFYTDNVSFVGKSGFTHVYDFLLQRTAKQPERLCKTINSASKSFMQQTLFVWNDTKEVRHSDSKLIVLFNDENRVDSRVITAFNSYDVDCIPWSERDKYHDFLAS